MVPGGSKTILVIQNPVAGKTWNGASFWNGSLSGGSFDKKIASGRRAGYQGEIRADPTSDAM